MLRARYEKKYSGILLLALKCELMFMLEKLLAGIVHDVLQKCTKLQQVLHEKPLYFIVQTLAYYV